jgi:hypothetical protein
MVKLLGFAYVMFQPRHDEKISHYPTVTCNIYRKNVKTYFMKINLFPSESEI